MEVDIESTLENMETENIQLSDALNEIEYENIQLKDQVMQLKKSLDKEKKLHRKFADEVVVTEETRISVFKIEKRLLVQENQSLVRENRQLGKDVEFYKKAHEELTKEYESNSSFMKSPSKPIETTSTSRSFEFPEKNTERRTRDLTKSNTKLFEENKTLKMKIADMKAALAVLKKKNKQCENIVKEINKKATKFNAESEQLEELIASTQTTNQDLYNPEALAKLDLMGNN
ncbi:tropomyosin-1-like [Bradysia coprophila]|uniref:tropomyosin-1-like n=1 Tax=Bradysia coprophila TaxID=38358 RepID=UPI00187D7E52|nr:tropomyosin-1-like [Bradysia coprophila]